MNRALVTRDTVGDQCTVTAGQAVNPTIKITNILTRLLLSVLTHMCGTR